MNEVINTIKNRRSIRKYKSESIEKEVLEAIVEAGFPVVSFGAEQRTLEDVFMQVTQGLVQ